MGQYHHLANITAKQWVDQYTLGAGAKEWEQVGGNFTAALPFLLAPNPGNMPGDLGWHPLVGAWAGHQLLVVGDYAENSDKVRGYQGPPLSKLYSLCERRPDRNDRWAYGSRDMTVAQADAKFTKDLAAYEKKLATGRIFADISSQIHGAVEFARSVRFCGDGWMKAVPVEPFARRGKDGMAHYVMKSTLHKRDMEYFCRMIGLPETLAAHTSDLLPPAASGLERWPWDRAPHDLSFHNATDDEQDAGQQRVWLNLDSREYIDPAKMGEVPTVSGLMRATSQVRPRLAIDMLVTAGGIESNVKEGDAPDFCSADAVHVMLMHPESRGGGDIDVENFPLKGRWRQQRILLTPWHDTEHFPGTQTVRTTGQWRDLTDEVIASLAKLAAAG